MKKLTKKQMEVVKREHPEWFNGIEVGKWYFKQYDRESSIIFFCQGHRSGIAYGYGIDTSNNGKTEWLSDSDVVESNNDGFREATPEEVKQALIDEAKRRYKVGDRIKSLRNDWVHNIGEMQVDVLSPTKEWNYWVVTVVAEEDEWNKMCSNPTVFKDGQWASVIPQEKPSLQDDIQALKDRWPDINFTIIAEGRK